MEKRLVLVWQLYLQSQICQLAKHRAAITDILSHKVVLAGQNIVFRITGLSLLGVGVCLIFLFLAIVGRLVILLEAFGVVEA